MPRKRILWAVVSLIALGAASLEAQELPRSPSITRTAYVECRSFKEVVLFASPGDLTALATTLKCGESVTVLGEEAGWKRVRTENGKEGYAAAAFVREELGKRLETKATISILTNKDVLDMLKIGLSAEIVAAKIKSSVCSFDTSLSALEELKTVGVPESVILAMVQAPVAGAKTVEALAEPSLAPLPDLPQAVEVKLVDGTSFEIELKETVSSEDVQEGSVIDFTVIQPVTLNGLTVIEKGAPAKARVVEVKKARHWGRAGKIVWAMQDVVTVDGNKASCRFTKEAEGGGSSGKVAAAVVVTAIVFWPAAPVWGLKKGKAAVIPAGQRYQVFIHNDSIVKVQAPKQRSED